MLKYITALAVSAFLFTAAFAVELPSEGDTIPFQGYLCKTEEARDDILSTYSEQGQEYAAEVQRAYIQKGVCGLARGLAVIVRIGESEFSADGTYKLTAVTIRSPKSDVPFFTFLRLPSNAKSA